MEEYHEILKKIDELWESTIPDDIFLLNELFELAHQFEIERQCLMDRTMFNRRLFETLVLVRRDLDQAHIETSCVHHYLQSYAKNIEYAFDKFSSGKLVDNVFVYDNDFEITLNDLVKLKSNPAGNPAGNDVIEFVNYLATLTIK